MTPEPAVGAARCTGMPSDTPQDRPTNDPDRIVPDVYHRQRAEGLDHLVAYRTAVLTYRRIRPDADDAAATAAVSRILDEAGVAPDGTKARRGRRSDGKEA